jgi:hypothetical protein
MHAIPQDPPRLTAAEVQEHAAAAIAVIWEIARQIEARESSPTPPELREMFNAQDKHGNTIAEALVEYQNAKLEAE